MAQPATRVSGLLARGVKQQLKPHVSRPFCTTSLRAAARAPTIADISLQEASTFEAKQKEFRDRQAAAREKAASQSPSSSGPGGRSVSASEVASARASSVETALNSPTVAGEPREPTESAGDASTAAGDKKRGTFSSIIYGTPEGREHEQEIEHSYSQTLARGKYVHSITFHEVKPGHVDEYVELIAEMYPKIANDPKSDVHLVGSWRTEVHDVDTFGESRRTAPSPLPV